MKTFTLRAIGTIHNDGEKPCIEIDEPYLEAMDGLESFSHVNVFFWFHENDNREGRAFLKVHPCKNPETPLTGVFATHSPLRPNLIGMTRCRMTGLDKKKGLVFLDEIDAIDGSPLLDLKCYIPPDDRKGEVVVPNWK